MEKELEILDAKIELIKQDINRLFYLYSAERTPPPFARGETYFPSGDQIPSHGSPAENLVGKVWAFTQNGKSSPFILSKNTTDHPIRAGDVVSQGKVDHHVRYAVERNNFFWAEL